MVEGTNHFVPGEVNKINTQYGFTANKITAETTATTAQRKSLQVLSGDGVKLPDFDRATLKLTPSGMVLGWRYAATDAGR